MRLFLIATAVAMIGPSGALAMMPSLTEFPVIRTGESCQKWAAVQDEDAIAMWGLLESGKTSEDVGKLRLALSCLGDRPPEIVGFGSSVGVADQYCRTHARMPVCRNRR